MIEPIYSSKEHEIILEEYLLMMETFVDDIWTIMVKIETLQIGMTGS